MPPKVINTWVKVTQGDQMAAVPKGAMVQAYVWSEKEKGTGKGKCDVISKTVHLPASITGVEVDDAGTDSEGTRVVWCCDDNLPTFGTTKELIVGKSQPDPKAQKNDAWKGSMGFIVETTTTK